MRTPSSAASHSDDGARPAIVSRAPVRIVTAWAGALRELPVIGHYVADFAYVDERTGQRVIEDVKGVKTAMYRWKKKHTEAQYGITITEV